MTDRDNTIKERFEQLAAQRDDKGMGLTQQAMAELLNKEGFPSLSGQPWSKYSIRRVLKNLSLQGTASSSPPRRAGRKPATKPATPTAPSRPALRTTATEEVAEHKLKESSPLMQWNYYESIRDLIGELTSKPCSEKSLAVRLNKMAVPTADGKPWSATTVSRVLKVLSPSNSVQISEEVIRDRIRLGWYDTDTEHFVAIAVKQKKPAAGKTPKISRKKEKNKKNDGKKDKKASKCPSKKKSKGKKKK